MNEQQKAIAAAGGVLALGAGYLLTQGESAAEAAEELPVEVPEEAVDTVESWRPAYEDAEWGISANGVLYDDPETGPANDEPGDDANTSFETIEEETGGAVDAEETAESYAPDTEDADAPNSGVVADPGDSQEFGTAPEQENDDLNDVGNMDDETAAMFDRLANYDDADQLGDSGGSSSSSSSSYSYTDDSDDSDDSGGSAWADTYDGGTGGLTLDDNDVGYTSPEW